MAFFTTKRVAERLLRHQNIDLKWSNLNCHIFNKLKKSAILVPLFVKNGEVNVLLTMRSQKLRSEGGLVSFPGGLKDKADHDETETCLREASEEVGLKSNDVEVVCQFLPWITKGEERDLLVTPVAGILSSDFKPEVNHDEVEFTFSLPLRRFLSKERHSAILYRFKGAELCIHFFMDTIDGKLITTWGLTAGVCIQIAMCVLQETPSYQWVHGVPQPILQDPFLDLKSILRNLEKIYSEAYSKL